MNRPLTIGLIGAAVAGLLAGAWWLWWRYGAAVFLGGGVGFC